MRRRRALAWITVAGVLAGCGAASEPWRPPHLLLISIDTLRADHLPVYGYAQPTAPQLDALARQSMVFERAYTHAPLTLPSHTSLLTGMYPERHGVHDREDRLAEGVATLAGTLRAQGYRTGAFTNAYFLSRAFGLDQGFDHYDAVHDIHGRRDAAETNRAAREWIDWEPQTPGFAFVHYFDVHSDWERLPYDAPAEFRERFAPREPRAFPAGDGELFASRYMARMNREKIPYTEAQRRYVKGLYDAGIAYTDAQLGAFLDALAASGWLARAIVIVTSDHGEEFQEHGRLLHTQLYEEQMRVPLLVSLPEMRGEAVRSCRDESETGAFRAGRSDALVQLVDVLPTLAACLGVALPEGAQGHSFLASLAGGHSARTAAYYDHPRRDRAGVMADGWKLIDAPDAEEVELYDLAADPAEQANVAAREPERVRALRDLLAAHRDRAAEGAERAPARAVPESVHRELEALGYVRGESDAPDPDAPEPDAR